MGWLEFLVVLNVDPRTAGGQVSRGTPPLPSAEARVSSPLNIPALMEMYEVGGIGGDGDFSVRDLWSAL